MLIARFTVPLLAAAVLLGSDDGKKHIPCSVVALRNNPEGYQWPLANIRSFVAEAEIIVRAVPRYAVTNAPPQTVMFPTQMSGVVKFDITESLRGRIQGDTVHLPGDVVAIDDFNRGAVPYRMVRLAGQRGDCIAREYRIGAEYLLLLKNTPRGLSPYWAPLAPLNEQIRGHDDDWLKWVRTEITARRDTLK